MFVFAAVFSATERVRAATIAEDRCLVDICDVYRDGNTIIPTIPIGDRDGYRIGGLAFIIERCTCSQLPGSAVNAKRARICATETIFQSVVVCICRRNGTADVDTGTGILRNGAGCTITLREHRRAVLVYVRDIDSDADHVSATIAIRDGDRHRIRYLPFIVKRRFRA